MRTFDLENTAANRRNRRISDVLIKFGGVVFCAVLFAIPAKAQDDVNVAAAARQTRQHSSEVRHERHVYTNEDLTAPQILTPEDQDHYAAARTVWEPPKGWELADILPPDVQPLAPPPPPLGDVARGFRLARDAQRITVPTYVPTPAYAAPARSRAIEDISGSGSAPAIPGFSNSAAPLAHGASILAAPAAPTAGAATHAMPVMISNLHSPAVAAPLAHAALSPASHAVPDAAVQAHLALGGLAPMLSYSSARAFPRALSSASAIPAAPHATQATILHAASRAIVHAAQPSTISVAPHSVTYAAPMLKPLARAANTAAGTVQIRSGETLWRLATEYLGSGYRWHQIAELNPSLGDPTRIEAGTSLRMPQPAIQAAAQTAAVGSYLVKSGDSMWKIAEAQLGKGDAWVCVAHANPGVQNPNLIFPGEAIRLPAFGESGRCE